MKTYAWFGLLLLWPVVQAIFEDQAGQSDWYQQHIGGVSLAEFAFRSRERVFLATDSDVVASLDLRDGEPKSLSHLLATVADPFWLKHAPATGQCTSIRM